MWWGNTFPQNKQTSIFIMSLLKNTYSQPPLGLLTQTYVILLHHVYTRKCIFHGKITQEWILWTRMVTDSVTSGQERMMGNKTYTVTTTGCLNSICAKKTPLLAIKNALLSHKNNICTFMWCGHLTYDPWIWLKVTSMASTASNRKSV